ncbi:DEAD/DEAH box helicase family protein [Stigmatella sp. ncwal1]|uniref:DEAD/DEAH box helicase family protein n=1 Tax=Stigmatella ashevillensis TaxID=2995309 RepID=A0ABT5DLY0_9BACT|nr:DEAD/DEAH box helicase family protein [Stigmatella ashevillena]MDC0714667.1 DEAD/DEAH box helicase family protein [Stigmatella ashevillena]
MKFFKLDQSFFPDRLFVFKRGREVTKSHQFQRLTANVSGNPKLRDPQREGFEHISRYYPGGNNREISLVLPVGCGKSGLIAIAPFALRAKRVLVIAPGTRIAAQLLRDADPSEPKMFSRITGVLAGDSFPEPAEIRGKETNLGDLEVADVVITNIQQLQGEENRTLTALSSNFFDLILVDEGHHNVAASWELIRTKFSQAKIINFSATPCRADGQPMAGEVIYSYPIFKAIEKGYVKRLKAVVLNPSTLKYVRREDGEEIEVGLEEVRRLGETEADFRRSVVSSAETLKTIVDASINRLYELREKTKDPRHKIIASALNYEHCIQITKAYRERNLRAEFVHSRESAKSVGTLKKLEAHELDVIVQVRMLGEGFDHRYLSVAAVCSVFANLSPFVQFVGRIMRAIEQDSPNSSLNEGVVVFHAGSNIAKRWADFQQFSQADKEYFEQLLPMEELDFTSANELVREPQPLTSAKSSMEVRTQQHVTLEEIPLIERDNRAKEALNYLVSQGFTPEDFAHASRHVAIHVTKQSQRQAGRIALDERSKLAAGRVLKERGINPMGRELDRQRLGRENLVVLKAAIDRLSNELVQKSTKERDSFTQLDLDRIEASFDSIVTAAEAEVFDGAS